MQLFAASKNISAFSNLNLKPRFYKLEKAEMFLEAANGGHKSTTKYVPCELLTLSCF